MEQYFTQLKKKKTVRSKKIVWWFLVEVLTKKVMVFP